MGGTARPLTRKIGDSSPTCIIGDLCFKELPTSALAGTFLTTQTQRPTEEVSVAVL